jgi:hypothetical protein
MASSARLEHEHRAGTALGVDAQGESFLECGREGDDAVFAALALVIRMRQVSRSTSAIRIRTSSETRTPV